MAGATFGLGDGSLIPNNATVDATAATSDDDDGVTVLFSSSSSSSSSQCSADFTSAPLEEDVNVSVAGVGSADLAADGIIKDAAGKTGFRPGKGGFRCVGLLTGEDEAEEWGKKRSLTVSGVEGVFVGDTSGIESARRGTIGGDSLVTSSWKAFLCNELC